MDVALFTQEGLIMILRWVHFFAGIAWIGHLYYFNFCQTAFMPEVEAGVKNQVFSKLVPRALWWFRWGAMGTFLSGLAMLSIVGKDLAGDFFQTPYGIYIYTGALLGTLMFLNVWLIIWPIQKGLIANANAALSGGTPDAALAAKAPKAALASRTNVLFSIPMLFFMGASRHLGLNIPEGFSPMAVLGAVTVVILALEVNAIKGGMGPLKSVPGVIHCGLGLLIALYAIIEVVV
jgi:uncharacterized membrane protein